MRAKNFKDLEVWQLAMTLATTVYHVTGHFPESERFGLTSQMRRAAVSVPSNIAEGHGRKSSASYATFLRIALGSLNEVETLVILARRLGLSLERDGSEELEPSIRRLAIKLQNLLNKVADSVREERAAYGEEF